MVNKAIIVGNLGADPELKRTPSGEAVCNLSIATSESWVGKDGEKQESTEWHKVQAWGKLAENCAKYLKKGRTVYVEGAIKTRSYEKDGTKRFITEIRAREVKFLGGDRQNREPVDSQETQPEPTPAASVADTKDPWD